MSLEVNVLGPVEAYLDGRAVTPSAPKIRRVLAMLALRCGKIVPAEQIMDELWGENPPKSSTTTLQTYIYQLRRSVFDVAAGLHAPSLVTRTPGYLLNLPSENVDAWRFKRDLDRGRELMARGQTAAALKAVNDALRLRRGNPLADVRCGLLLEGQVAALNEDWLSAVELRFDAELLLGTHANIIGDLRELVNQNPLNEKLHAQLMLALHKSGRRADALGVYQQIRANLREELGSDPSPVLREAQAVVLGGQAREHIRASGPATRARDGLVPRQLPPDISDFTGRGAETAQLADFVASPGGRDSSRVVSVTGGIGSGKTSLAVHVAHRVKERFPDGQLYAEMRAADGTQTSAREVLGRFLRSLHYRTDEIPESLPERASLFRSALAPKSMLVLLNGVEDAGDIRELIPAGPGNAVIVTNRRPAYGLPGARELKVGPMTADDAVRLLSAVAWNHPVAEHPDAARKVVELCGRVPLAVRAAAERLRTWNCLTLDDFANRLEHRTARLSELRTRDFDLAARIAEACDALDVHAREVLRQLAIRDPAVFSERRVRQLAPPGCDVESVLTTLLESRLITFAPSGEHRRPQFQIPELARLYALEQLSAPARAAS